MDYEHIEPEFHHAKEHDPSKMTLLCISCHGRVTRKVISKKAVWDAKANPKALQEGFVRDLLFVDTSEMQINVGKSTCRRTKVILAIHGKPIIWFEPPSIEGEPSKLCAIFHDDNGKPISYINRNQFVAHSNSQDIKSEATSLHIKSNDKTCLEINREGGHVLHITKMHGNYLGVAVSLDSEGGLLIKQGTSSSTIGRIDVDNVGCAIWLGNPHATTKHRKIYTAITLARRLDTRPVINHKNELVGWILGNEIFSRNYELAGISRNGKAFALTNEYIGNLTGPYIAHKDNCYETGEPIFTSQSNIEFRDRNPWVGYDVSFRLFAKRI